ncbi:MAG TPA: hypothetical protein VFN49_03670 [Candidatus Aquilonibacter sp.]|nr:hypothetical protein [Candidatus Aquilonibacter sp.]
MNDDRKDTAPNDAFYDDSSSALGLSHAANVKSPGIEQWKREEDEKLKAALRSSGILRDPEGNVIPSNAGAYRDIEARTRELHAQGMPLAEATRVALEEMPATPDEAKVGARDSYLGDSVVNLMSRKAPGHGGSGSRGAGKPPKPMRSEGCHACKARNTEDVIVCQKCGAELPIAASKKRGRRAKFPGRHERVRTRISSKAKSGIAKAGLSDSDALEILGLALATGRTFEAVRSEHALQRASDVA